jgi:hypothetical protein
LIEVSRHGFKATNHFAVAGFLLPFVSAAVTAGLVLLVEEEIRSLRFSLLYLSLVPLILLAGLLFSIRSIPLIAERGDKDYAHAGLTLNILFLCVYILSLVYFFSLPTQ